ncbi:hypothetical protein TNCV_419441 [Trichonephila clavipes]|uniref:RNase H type-1 domain-containing protein n=1 Tax=Trichonephila clavipes TaxID=2585209 RepID=A0A8X6VE95_TRICX|nr:hypothetical protein TNCV_419441 [Trichonephila clavipes]
MALETIHGIPHLTLNIYTDGSMGEGGNSGYGVHIKAPNGAFNTKVRMELKQRITIAIKEFNSDTLTRIWVEMDYRLNVSQATKAVPTTLGKSRIRKKEQLRDMIQQFESKQPLKNSAVNTLDCAQAMTDVT